MRPLPLLPPFACSGYSADIARQFAGLSHVSPPRHPPACKLHVMQLGCAMIAIAFSPSAEICHHLETKEGSTHICVRRASHKLREGFVRIRVLVTCCPVHMVSTGHTFSNEIPAQLRAPLDRFPLQTKLCFPWLLQYHIMQCFTTSAASRGAAWRRPPELAIWCPTVSLHPAACPDLPAL